MSSPASRRSQRASQAGTPRRSARNPQVASSSPGPAVDEQLRSEASNGSAARGTPRASRLQQSAAASSPLFYLSSPAGSAALNGAGASSPLRQATDGDRTPRASGNAARDSSPIRYASSSSAAPRNDNRGTEFRSESSGLFVRSSGSTARNRRGDINSDVPGSSTGRRRRLFVDENGNAVGEEEPAAGDTAMFSDLDPTTSDADVLGGISTRTIWGTNVSLQDTTRTFTGFLRGFQTKYRMHADGEIEDVNNLPADHPGNSKKYYERLRQMFDLGLNVLNLDTKDLKAYPTTRKMWTQLQSFPSEIVPIMDSAIKDIVMEIAEAKMNEMVQGQRTNAQRNSSSVPPMPSSDIDHQGVPSTPAAPPEIPDLFQEVNSTIYKVRPFGLDKTINLRDLNPGDMDKLVSIKGLVIRTTPIIPDMKDAFFRCAVCGHTVKADLDRGKVTEPSKCPRNLCSSPNSMQIIHNRSGFADKQVIKLQETPDNVPDGQTPHSVSLCAYDELVDVCKAGDRVEITGIFKCAEVRVNPRQRSVKNIFKTYIDATHIQKVDKRRLGLDTSTLEELSAAQAAGGVTETRKVTAEEEAKIKETAAREDIYELLSRSLAPSIYELDDVKKGILLQLFGGTNKSFQKGGSPRYRGDINVLLCGDPSTAKSQLLQYVHKIAPRGVYTSGKGSSAVGLTAYITRDPETRQLVLESGALVLSDGGVCCIDEFDKMSDATRSVLHEVMEQQTVSIAKAGIITTLNARTSILASANPIGSKYNINLPVPQNIDLPPTLLSRFDLVYLVLDNIDEQNDRRLAKHIVGMYLEDTPEHAAAQEVLPVEFLTSYISYARTHIHPTLTTAASKTLVESYVALRALGADLRAADRRITATTRQLESMIRLAEAHAKMRLSTTVTEADVLEAVRLIKSAIKQSATDARTGLIDMGLLTEGTSASERKRKEELRMGVLGVVDELCGGGASARVADVVRRMSDGASASVEGAEILDALRALESEGRVMLGGEGARRTVRRITGAGTV